MGRNFAVVFSVAVFGLFIFIVSFNAIIDPPRMFHDSWFARIPTQGVQEHVTVPQRIRVASNIGTLILGSSTARYIVPDVNNRIRKFKGLENSFVNRPVFNAAISAATIQTAVDVFSHSVALHDIKEAIYVLPFDGLNANAHKKRQRDYDPADYNGRFGIKDLVRILSILWSPELTRASFLTVTENFLPKEFPLSFGNKSKSFDGFHRWKNNFLEWYYPGYYRDMKITENETNKIEELINIAQQRTISFSIIIPPLHPIQMEMIFDIGIFEQYVKHLRVITEIADKFNISLVAFNPYHAALSENYFEHKNEKRESDAPAFYDGAHFNEFIGYEMTRFLKAGKSQLGPGFGLFLSPERVEGYIDSLIENRSSYLAERSDVSSVLPDCKSIPVKLVSGEPLKPVKRCYKGDRRIDE